MNKLIDAIYGFAIGDALGVPVEFLKRETVKKINYENMIGYGTHNMPEGTWSDDTSMVLATLDSINECNGINYDNIMKKFCNWYFKADYTATGVLFDIGNTTYASILKYIKYKTSPTDCGGPNINDNGNGSLMRILPVSFYISLRDFNYEERKNIINNISSLTHSHEISKLGCNIYSNFVYDLLNGMSKEEAYKNLKLKDYSNYQESTRKYYNRILNFDISKLNEKDIKSSGFIVDSLEACIWCILTTDNYRDAVLKAIALGNDTDTIGAITGGLAGILYGVANIPEDWLKKLKNRELIDSICNKYDLINIKEKNSMENSDYDRFSWKPGDVKFLKQDGSYVKNEKDYFDNRKKEMLTISNELQIGDVVKLKLTGEVVTIDKIDHAGFKYAGYVQGESKLTLFSQEDIEEVLSESRSHSI